MDKRILFALVFFTSLSVTFGQSTAATSIYTNESVFVSWLPIIVLAMLVGTGIAVIYYVISIVINNSTMKSAALSEFTNVIGTGIIVVIVIALFGMFGTAATATSQVSPTVVSQICSQLSSSQLNFVNSSASIGSPTSKICSSLIPNNAGTTDITKNLDYGLASTYVILANLTSQTAVNINALYVFNGYISFLSQLAPTDRICFPALTCLEGGVAGVTAEYGYSPFAGYSMITTSTGAVTTQAGLIFLAMMLQLIGIIITLFAWPYILAAGIILRSSFLTRRMGGFLIAFCITGLLIYPAIFLIQYGSLNSITSSTGQSPLVQTATGLLNNITGTSSTTTVQAALAAACNLGAGSSSNFIANSIPTIGVVGTAPNGTKKYYCATRLNFYVFPRLDYILNNTGCWPSGGNLLTQELKTAGAYLIPGYGLGVGLSNFVGSFTGSGSSTTFFPGGGCNTPAAINSVFALINVYGMMSVVGIILPVIDVLLALAALISISGLLGGATRLFGLEKLI